MSDQTLNNEEEMEQPAREPESSEQRTIGGAGVTLALMGLIDVLGHMGPTGLVVSGLASYVVWRHGPEVYHLVQHELGLPELGARFGRKKEPGFNKRTFWQKAWNIYPQVEEAEDEAQTGALEDIGAAARPEIFADPTQERSGPVMERITVEEAIAHTERNSYQVYVGRSLTDDGVGRAVKTGFGDRHMKFIGASQRGKSSMVAALLTTIAATHDPSHVQFAILDLENLTGRLFADVPHIKRLRVDGAEVRLHATNPDQVLEYLVYLVKFMEYRYHLSPNDLARQPILIVYIEEFLRLRRLFKARIASNSPGPARDAARRTYAALLESIDALAARGLKARIRLWLCAQVDYADEDLREALANVTDGMAFGLKTTAAQAAGFYEAEMLAENARTKRAGQCVVETADMRDLILAIEFNLTERLRTLEMPAPIYTPSGHGCTFEVRSETGPLDAAAEMDIPEPPPMQPIPLRKEATVEQAYQAWQNGATGVRPIQRALGIPYSTARDLVIEMQRQGLIPPQTQASGGE